MMASESHTVTSPSISAGTLPDAEKLEKSLLVGHVTGIERNEDLLESDVIGTQGEPRPHRP